MSTKTKKIIAGIVGIVLVLTVAIIKQSPSINIEIKSGEFLKYAKKSMTNLVAATSLTPTVITSVVVPKLELTTCTSFTYTNWKACNCTTFKKTRDISSSSPALCVNGNPILSSSCTCNTTPVNVPNNTVNPQKAGTGTDNGSQNMENSAAKSGENSENKIAMPATLKEIKSEEIYKNKEYKNEVLKLIVADTENCSGDNSTECFKKAYGLETLKEKEVGDAVVFNIKPGKTQETPIAPSLHGNVGSDPAVFVASKPNELVTLKISASVGKNGQSQKVYVMTTTVTTDSEGKGVAILPKKLLPGPYVADISAQRKTASIGKASVLDSSTTSTIVEGQEASFTVGENVDTEFYISDLEIKKENVHEPYQGETKEMVSFLLANLNTIESGFDVQKYIEFSRTGGVNLFTEGKVSQGEIKENSVVYLTYQSVILGSAVISDASQEGAFRVKVPKELLAKTTHNLNLYAYNPKQSISSSLKSLKFQALE